MISHEHWIAEQAKGVRDTWSAQFPFIQPRTTARGRTTSIAGAEWTITITLTKDGAELLEPVTLTYTDTYLAQQPMTVGYLIAARCNEWASKLKGKK